MKIIKLYQELYTAFGLKLINSLARSSARCLSAELAYGNQDRHMLDYYTLGGDVNRPTILFFYGGNWRSGSRSDYLFVADTLLSLGYNVIIPDYRLYPLVRFSEIQKDAAAATRRALDEVPEDQAFFVMGHSAGAQLGALLCLDASLLGENLAARISGFIGLAGPYDFYPFSDADHWDLFGPESEYAQSQAVNFVRADSPPLYLLHGETDTRVRRGNSKSLMQKVHAVGGSASREVYKETGHVDIILNFTRLHRKKSPLIKDITHFLSTHSSR
ncbi:MAG: acetyl esterase/lipase [Candidatus Azotimanducaceae bacterium]